MSDKLVQLRQQRIKREKKELERKQRKEALLKERCNNIKNCKIIKKAFRKGRWFVILEHAFNGNKRIPLAHYVWLKGNPAFHKVPPGYVIHHLDYDELNDDITNLVLMLRQHHIAHHWKQGSADPEIKIEFDWGISHRTDFYPLTEPKIYPRTDGKAFYVQFRESINKDKTVKVYNYNGQILRTREDAENFKSLIWQPNNKKSIRTMISDT